MSERGSMRTLVLGCVVAALACQPALAAASRCADRFSASARPVPTGANPWAATVGDFDGDRRADVAVGRIGSHPHGSDPGGVTVVVAGRVVTVPAGPVSSIASGQFTGDGVLDLAVGTSNHGVSVLAGDGRGNFATTWTQSRPGDNPLVPLVLAAADVNHDDRADLLVSDRGDVRVLLNDGSGALRDAGEPVRYAQPPDAGVPGDFNGDGHPDFAVGSFFGSGALDALLGNGTGVLLRDPKAPGWPSSRAGVHAVAAADFDRDGLDDVAAISARGVFVRFGDAAGLPRTTTVLRGDLTGVGGLGDASLAAADFDADGNPDLAVASPALAGQSGMVTVLMGDGEGGFWPAAGGPERLGSALKSLVAGDFSGDGRADLAALDVPYGGTGDLRTLVNTGGRGPRRGTIPIDIRRQGFGAVPYGSRTNIVGRLRCEPYVVRGRRLVLERRLETPAGLGPWRRIGQAKGTRGGLVRWTGRPPANALYRWRQADARGPELRTSLGAWVGVAQRVTVRVRGDRISGRVTPAHAGAPVRLEQRTFGEWTVVARTRLARDSTYRFRAHPSTDPYRVNRLGDADHMGNRSRTFWID
jgi:hypothetical protein